MCCNKSEGNLSKSQKWIQKNNKIVFSLNLPFFSGLTLRIKWFLGPFEVPLDFLTVSPRPTKKKKKLFAWVLVSRHTETKHTGPTQGLSLSQKRKTTSRESRRGPTTVQSYEPSKTGLVSNIVLWSVLATGPELASCASVFRNTE